MPTPYGTISTSEGPVNPEDKQYEVVATYKVRKRTVVAAPAKEAAEAIASGYFSVDNSDKYDEFISEYAIEVKETE